VFHAITNELKSGYYGILTQGFPQLVRVNADVLGLETEQPLPENVPALCRARMIHEYPLIPDVERLERMIADLPTG
jgi:chemosensory pili system protein ChpC